MFDKLLEDIVYDDIISLDNLLGAWEEFLRGKKSRKDVQMFQFNLMDNILTLHNNLKNKTYRHGSYEAFNISDPKPRNIHKASVRDRLLHHAVYRQLYPHFDRKFIAHSYSCQKCKGTHLALSAFTRMARQVSGNNTKTCWVLKCDIRKFFAVIDHQILQSILRRHIRDSDILRLLELVIDSFHTKLGKGLPLGNLTSQILVNIYMNEFDQWIKHSMKVKWYIRYADDFVIMHTDKDWLLELASKIDEFLEERLMLALHPNKLFLKTLASGVDFLGWVHFPYNKVLRTSTKRRLFKNIVAKKDRVATVQSYIGLLKQGNTFNLQQTFLCIIEDT